MSDIYNSLKQELAKKNKSNKNQILQTIDIPIVWDWQSPSLGTTGASAYNFFDRIPSNFKSKSYTQSSNSFSQNYSSFLGLIDEEIFPLKNELVKIKNSNNPKPPLPPSGPMPAFWTMVQHVSSTNQLSRAYTLSDYPSQWITSIATSAIRSELDIESSGGLINFKKDHNFYDLDASNIKYGFKAEAWGTIIINTEGWYSSSIVNLIRQNKGPYVSGVSQKNVFSNKGLIPGRVSSLIVALNPTAYIKVHKKNTSNLLAKDVSSLNIGGFNFGKLDSGINIPSDFSMKTINENTTQITATPNSNENTAYIIAVQLEKF